MEKSLKEIFLDHKQKKSDKWSLYIDEWDRIFSAYRYQPINIFEIGIQNGGSLEIWAKYFPNAKNIVGCDIDEKCKDLVFNDSRITVFVGDANADDIQKRITECAPKFDIIIDDGSHRSSDVIRSFSRYFQYLKYEGIYIIEDIHASYWQNFEGGLFDPRSSMAFLKSLTDILNHEHWRNHQSRAEFLCEFGKEYDVNFSDDELCDIHSIEFLNSLSIIKKCKPDKNVLGNRIVVGQDEIVTRELEQVNGSSIHDMTFQIKDDSDLCTWNLIRKAQYFEQENAALKREIGEKDRVHELEQKRLREVNSQLEKIVDSTYKEIAEYYNSTSWKITRPFRWIEKKLGGKSV